MTRQVAIVGYAFRLPGGREYAEVKGQRARHVFRDSRAAADAAFSAHYAAEIAPQTEATILSDGCSGMNLVSGASCTIGVQVTPTTYGSKGFTLSSNVFTSGVGSGAAGATARSPTSVPCRRSRSRPRTG